MKEHDITNALKSIGQSLSMTEQESQRVFDVLQEHIAYTDISKAPQLLQPSPYTRMSTWIGRIAAVTTIALVITGSGLIAAADQALPGDALYGVKTNISEELKSFLQPTASAKLAFEVDRTQKRLDEARILIQRDTFDEKAQTEIKKSIEKHSIKITEHAQEVAQTDKQAFETIIENLEQEIRVEKDALALAARESNNEIVLASAASVLTTTEEAVEQISEAGEVLEETTDDTIEPAEEDAFYSSDYLAFVFDDMTQILEQTHTPQTVVEVVSKITPTKEEAVVDINLPVETLDIEETLEVSETTKESISTSDTKKVQKLYDRSKQTYDNLFEQDDEASFQKVARIFIEQASDFYNALDQTLPTPNDIGINTNGVILPPIVTDKQITTEEETSANEETNATETSKQQNAEPETQETRVETKTEIKNQETSTSTSSAKEISA